MDLRNLVENSKRRLIDDYVNVLRNKVDDLTRKIWRDDETDVFANQYPGKCVPFSYSRTYGKFQYNGITAQNPTPNPRIDFLLPSRPSPGNLIVGREGAFHLVSMNYAAFSTMSFSPIGSAVVPTPGDLFDSFFYLRGGAVGETNRTNQLLFAADLDGIAGADSSARLAFDPIGFELEFYDKKRDRALHEDRLPSEQINGANYTNKKISQEIRFDSNTEIEPRVYITSPIRSQAGVQSVGELPAGTVNFDRWMWINIMFKGYLELEV